MRGTYGDACQSRGLHADLGSGGGFCFVLINAIGSLVLPRESGRHATDAPAHRAPTGRARCSVSTQLPDDVNRRIGRRRQAREILALDIEILGQARRARA